MHHLYRALDFLDGHTMTVEKAVLLGGRDLFNLDIDLVFLDTTSTYFVGGGQRVWQSADMAGISDLIGCN